MNVTLKLGDLSYYSTNDEAAFFEWIDKISCIKSYRGEGKFLYIEIDNNLNQIQMRELLSLFQRYNKDMKILLPLMKPSFSKWMKSPSAYWYTKMFNDQVKPDL